MKEETKNRIYKRLSKETKVKALHALAREYGKRELTHCDVTYDVVGVHIIAKKHRSLYCMTGLFNSIPSFCAAYIQLKNERPCLRIFVLT